MRPHPIGHGFDQGRPAALTGTPQRHSSRDRHGEHIVAVHLNTRHSESDATGRQRQMTLHPDRLTDRPLVVLTEEDNGRTEARSERECLRDITLAGRAVSEVGDDRGIRSVEFHAHGVSGGVQRLCTDDDRGRGDIVIARIPAGLC